MLRIFASAMWMLSSVTCISAAEPKVAERWAVLIGVDDYATAQDLSFCGADQRDLRVRLQGCGFANDHLFLLHDKAEDNKYKPSQRNIQRELDVVLNLAAEDDLLIVAFSGHGVSLGGKSYLCPSDAALDDPATLIPLDGIYDRLNNCAAKFKLMLVDACRNDPRPGGTRSLSATDGTRQLARSLQEIKLPQGVVLLNSCAPGEISWEEKDFGHGVYMHHVLEGLGGAADLNTDGAVSLNELQSFAGTRTKTYVARKFSATQRPFFKSEGESDLMEFALLPVKTRRPAPPLPEPQLVVLPPQNHRSIPVLDGLLNPSGLTPQPGSRHLMVSDSGAGRIFRFDTEDWTVEKTIGRFNKDVYGKGPTYDIGPLGLTFVGNRLVVGGGDEIDGKDVVYFFDLPPANVTMDASGAVFKTNSIPPGPHSHTGEGNFYGVASTNNAIYVTSNGDDTEGWVLKADIDFDGKPGELKPFIATRKKVNVDAPAGIAVDAQGRLVVSQMGELNVPGDSLLTIYDAKTGDLILRAQTELNDLIALAYSPRSGKLYGVDFSWMAPQDGGLYRLDLKMEGTTTSFAMQRICSLDKPAALCFGNDGRLYVTEFGTQGPDATLRPGRLVQIEGAL